MDHPESDEFDQVVGDWLPEFDPELEFYEHVRELVRHLEQFPNVEMAHNDATTIELKGKIYEKIPVKPGELALVKGSGRAIAEPVTDFSTGQIEAFSTYGTIMRLNGFMVVADNMHGGRSLPSFLAIRTSDEKGFCCHSARPQSRRLCLTAIRI